MRTLVTLLLLLLVSLTGCGGPSGPSGTYSIDKDALAKMADALVKGGEGEAKDASAAPMAAMMAEAFKAMDASLTFNTDGTFSGSSKMMGNESTMKGTWKLEGEKLSMTSTEEDGKPANETKVATFKDGVITVEEQQGGKSLKMSFKKV